MQGFRIWALTSMLVKRLVGASSSPQLRPLRLWLGVQGLGVQGLV